MNHNRTLPNSLEVDVIVFDPADIPDLRRFLFADDNRMFGNNNTIHPIKIDMPLLSSNQESSSLLSREIVAAILLYNLALASSLVTPTTAGAKGPIQVQAVRQNAIKLLLLSMDLVYQRFEIMTDVGEQVGLLMLAILAVKTILWVLQGNDPNCGESTETWVYRQMYQTLLDRARVIACMELVLLQSNRGTAAAA